MTWSHPIRREAVYEVYALRHRPTRRVYIGVTGNLKRRMYAHLGGITPAAPIIATGEWELEVIDRIPFSGRFLVEDAWMNKFESYGWIVLSNRTRDLGSKGGKIAGAMVAEQWARGEPHPGTVAGQIASFKIYRCDVCGKETTAFALGRHQSVSGHSGRTPVE